VKKKIFFSLVCIFILNISFLLQENNNTLNNNSSNDFRNIAPNSSDIDSWDTTWGGSDNEWASAIVLDTSGNIYLAGFTFSFGAGSSDFVLVKYDSSGNFQWYRTWGGSDEDEAWAIALDTSGNIYLAGGTKSYGEGGVDICLVKYDSSGNFQWYRTWAGGWAFAIALDSSDNIYIAGDTYSFGAGSSDMYLVKYDSSGNFQWYRTWGGSLRDGGRAIALDSSGNIYIAGNTESFGAGGLDLVLVKYDSSGNFQWYRTWGGSDWEGAGAIALDTSGNIYIAGNTESYGEGRTDMCLVKYDSSGNFQWYRTWGGIDEDGGEAIALDSSGNIYIAGNTESYGEDWVDMCLVKYDSSGNFQWYRTWGGSDEDVEWAYAIALDSSENIYIAGYTRSYGEGGSDICLVKNPKASKAKKPSIPSYNTLILISILCVTSVILAISEKLKHIY